MNRSTPLVVRLYAALTGLLPPDLHADRDEMVRIFAALREEARGPLGRGRVTARSFGALPTVLLLEWMEFLGVRRAPGRTSNGRAGMSFSRNLAYALRTLRNAPAFTLTSVILIGVGVGAVTTVFTLVDHALLRPLPYPAADRLVVMEEGSYPGPRFREMEGTTAAESWAAAWRSQVTLRGEGEPLRIREARVSEAFLDLFGARAQSGRLFGPDDFAGADVVVLDAGAWRRIWGGDPTVLGRSLVIDNRAFTVVGIVEDGFTPPERLTGREVDVWRPIDWSLPELSTHDRYVLEVGARLVPGATAPDLQAELDAVSARMAPVHENYRTPEGAPVRIPVAALGEATVGNVRAGLGLLMGAVSLLLLVACANVAHLFLARGLGRVREMAVRRAMGAANRNLVAQLLTESLVVGALGGVLGLAISWSALRAVLELNPTPLPRHAEATIDPRILAFTVGLSALTAVVFGLLPALRSMRGELSGDLHAAGRSVTAGRGARALRSLLVTGEVALSLVLVAGAGLLLRSFMAVHAQDPGFETEAIWTVPLNATEIDSPERYVALMDEVRNAAARVPGVRMATYGLTMPMEYVSGGTCCWNTLLRLPGRETDPGLRTQLHPVSHEYFTTLSIEVLAGTTWSRAETRDQPVPLVLGEMLARNLATEPASAVGMTIRVGQNEGMVVGVVADTRHYGLDQPIRSTIYLPVERLPFSIARAHLAVKVDPASGAFDPGALRQAVRSAAPNVPVTEVRSMETWMRAATAGRRFDSSLFGAFAVVTLLLAAAGLYGTLLYVAGQRRREFGIRIALGASHASIERNVLIGGLLLGALGVGIGLVGAWQSSRLLETRIWGVEHNDPVALGGAAALLLLTTALASWLPARRASRQDPMETLAAE